MNNSFFKIYFQILIFLYFFSLLNSQDISLITPSCNLDNIKYSIYANITDYIANNNNLDKREIFNKPTDLKAKKIGILSGFPINGNNYEKVEIFQTTEDLTKGLKNHTIDAIISERDVIDYIIIHNYDTIKIKEKISSIQYGLIFQKEKADIQKDFDEFTKKVNITTIFEKWTGINYDSQIIDKNLNGNKSTIKVIAYLHNRPYSYKDEKLEPTGSCLDLIYTFAKNAGYKIIFQEASSYDAQIDAIKQNNADVTCTYINDTLKNDINIYISQNIPNQDSFAVIRLSNSE